LLVVYNRFIHYFTLFFVKHFQIIGLRSDFPRILQKLQKIWLIFINNKAEILEANHFFSFPIRLWAKTAWIFERLLFEIVYCFYLINYKLPLQISREFTLCPCVWLCPKYKSVNVVIAQPALLISLSKHSPLSWARKLWFVPKLPLKNHFVETVWDSLLGHISLN